MTAPKLSGNCSITKDNADVSAAAPPMAEVVLSRKQKTTNKVWPEIMLQKLKQTLKESVGYNITKYIWTLGMESYFILQEPTLGAHIKFITTLEHLLGSTASVLEKKKLLSSNQIWKHMRDFASLLQQLNSIYASLKFLLSQVSDIFLVFCIYYLSRCENAPKMRMTLHNQCI